MLARVGTSGEGVQGHIGEHGHCQERASQSLRGQGFGSAVRWPHACCVFAKTWPWAIVPCGTRHLLAWPQRLWTRDCFRGRDVLGGLLHSNGWCRPGGWSLCSRGLLGYRSGGFKGLELCTSVFADAFLLPRPCLPVSVGSSLSLAQWHSCTSSLLVGMPAENVSPACAVAPACRGHIGVGACQRGCQVGVC